MPDRGVTLIGQTIKSTSLRAFIDPGRAGGSSVTIRNNGGSVVEWTTDPDDWSEAASIAVGATDDVDSIAYLRSVGGTAHVDVLTDGGAIEGVV
jgi:hypothetical protein